MRRTTRSTRSMIESLEGRTLMSVTLENVQITSYQLGTLDSAGRPAELLSYSFGATQTGSFASVPPSGGVAELPAVQKVREAAARMI